MFRKLASRNNRACFSFRFNHHLCMRDLSVGVKKGDWIEYAVTYHWHSPSKDTTLTGLEWK